LKRGPRGCNVRHPARFVQSRCHPVLFAIAEDAARYNYWVPANQGYRYGVFNPVDGVGTPFFGGYYGHADDDE
jgi:hypothetical protein